MSGTSPESTGDHTDNERKDIPRKRSKVSRACDACRRKKVRCDAEFSTTLQKVTKVCTNCLRTNESCSFARVPLKRGPTKGYSRDGNDRAEDSDTVASRSRLGLDLGPYSSAQLSMASISHPPHNQGLPNQNIPNHNIPNHNITSHNNIPLLAMPNSLGPHASLSLSLTSTATSLATSISSMSGNVLNHLSAAQSANHMRINTPPSPVPQLLVKPMLHRLKFLPSSPAPPIILPPLLSTNAQLLQQLQQQHQHQVLAPQVKLSMLQAPGTTLSPGPLSVKPGADAKDSRIQGPLWKVPYEMPTEPSGLDPLSPASMSLNSRRSSVDSVSLILTAGLRSRLPSLQPLTSLNSEIAMSDSDNEDVYVSRARASVSPQNSVSSLLSLNGRVGKLLTISGGIPQGATHSHSHSHSLSIGSAAGMFGAVPPPVYNYSVLLSSTAVAPQNATFSTIPYELALVAELAYYGSGRAMGQQAPMIGGPLVSPMGGLQNAPEYNFRVYYSRFHSTFPILPFDEQKFVQTLSDLLRESPQCMQLVQLFYAALNNLVQFQTISVDVSTALLHHFLDLYPLDQPGMPASENAMAVAMAALILINYTILIKGNMYSLAISIAGGYLNDLRVMQKFSHLCHESADLLTKLSPDNILLYLPRLQLCLFVIDDCYSLSYGTQPRVQGDFELLVQNLPQTFPSQAALLKFLENLPLAALFHRLLLVKDTAVTGKIQRKASLLVSTSNGAISTESSETSFVPLFMAILKDKYELYDFSVEVSAFMAPISPFKAPDEEIREQVHDFQLKLIRLVRKLSQSILDFANFISSQYFQAKSPSSSDSLSSPFYNVSYGHSFKLINVCKKLLDSLLEHIKDNEIISRLVKINNDLSILYNLLVSNLNNNFNCINSSKSFNGGMNRSSSGATLTPASDVPDVAGLGSASIQLISGRLESYNLSFNNNPAKFSAGTNGNYSANINGWKNDFISTFESFLLREDVEGWY